MGCAVAGGGVHGCIWVKSMGGMVWGTTPPVQALGRLDAMNSLRPPCPCRRPEDRINQHAARTGGGGGNVHQLPDPAA